MLVLRARRLAMNREPLCSGSCFGRRELDQGKLHLSHRVQCKRVLSDRSTPDLHSAWCSREASLARVWPCLTGDVRARGGEANDAVGWRSFRQETPPCCTCPPASPRSLYPLPRSFATAPGVMPRCCSLGP